MLHLVHASYTAAVAWLPWAFLGVDLVMERWTLPRAALVAVPLALIAFLGQPQLLWMALAGCALYTVGLALARRAADGAPPGAWPAPLACGVAIGAIQIVPLLKFSRTSVRPTLSMSGSLDQSITPHHLLLLGFPYLFGGSSHAPSFAAAWLDPGIQQEVGSYLGITILAIAVVGVAALLAPPAGARAGGDGGGRAADRDGRNDLCGPPRCTTWCPAPRTSATGGGCSGS